ncbi:MAG: class I SAM-dependent methyltransferase, partial [Bacteroidota bacterium]
MSLSYWLFRVRSTWRWYWSTKTKYDVHSPFMADFLDKVIFDQRDFHVFGLAQQIKLWWRQQSGTIQTLELGAPSKVSTSAQRSIRSLVQQSAVSDQCGKWLFKTALWAKAKHLVELGTNAGISSLYLHFADKQANLHTIEGNPETAQLAQRTFQIAKTSPALHLYNNTFAAILPPVLELVPQLDLLFIDGDHRQEATLLNVQTCLEKAQENSVFIIADIHWSPDMESAWKELQQLPEVTASLDTYHFGFLFFRKGITPGQHLSIIGAKWKPWRMGF